MCQSCLTFCNPRTWPCLAPPSTGFSRQEYWSGFPFSSPGDLAHTGSEPVSVESLPLAGRFFTTSATCLSKVWKKVCGFTNHELLIARFWLKLKKVGKTTRQFRYDLNQISYDYTKEVTNRFKGLDLIDRVPDELWTEVHDIEQGSRPSPRKRNAKKQNGCLRRPSK